MTRAMTRSSPPPRLASLGVLLWAATSLAMPLDTPTGAAHETDGIAAHEVSLQPAAHDFERRRTDVCRKGRKYNGASCCEHFLLDKVKEPEKPKRCEDFTYRFDAGCNCHQYFYYNGAPPPRPQHAHTRCAAASCAHDLALRVAQPPKTAINRAATRMIRRMLLRGASRPHGSARSSAIKLRGRIERSLYAGRESLFRYTPSERMRQCAEPLKSMCGAQPFYRILPI